MSWGRSTATPHIDRWAQPSIRYIDLERGVCRAQQQERTMIAACKAGFGLGSTRVASSPASLLHTPAVLHARWPEQMHTSYKKTSLRLR